MQEIEEAEEDLHAWAARKGRVVPDIYIEGETIERNDLTLAQILAHCDVDDDRVAFDINCTTALYTETFDRDTLLIHFLDERNRSEVAMKEYTMLKKHEKDPFYTPHDLIHRPSAVHEYGLSIKEVKASSSSSSSSVTCGYFKTVGTGTGKDTSLHTSHVLRFKTVSNVDAKYNSNLDICSACIIHRICKTPFPFICFRPRSPSINAKKKKKNKTNKP